MDDNGNVTANNTDVLNSTDGNVEGKSWINAININEDILGGNSVIEGLFGVSRVVSIPNGIGGFNVIKATANTFMSSIGRSANSVNIAGAFGSGH